MAHFNREFEVSEVVRQLIQPSVVMLEQIRSQCFLLLTRLLCQNGQTKLHLFISDRIIDSCAGGNVTKANLNFR